LHALAPLWEQRRRAGSVREGHGDLHLANVLQWARNRPPSTASSSTTNCAGSTCCTTSPSSRWDLLAHGQRALAFRFINACLEASGDYDGLPALRFYLVSRALVRAQVAAIAEEQGGPPGGGPGAAGYLALPAALVRGADPPLAITHGLPGSGKSHVSQRVIEADGAIRVRSDVERKRLFGLAALASSGGLARPPGRRHLRRRDDTPHLCAAGRGGAGGWPFLVDAAFLRRAERRHVAALAGRSGCRSRSSIARPGCRCCGNACSSGRRTGTMPRKPMSRCSNGCARWRSRSTTTSSPCRS